MIRRLARWCGNRLKRRGPYRIYGDSVRGRSHRQANKPNQDSFAKLSTPDSFFHQILAVADGHGSATHFRSDKGAQFAVQAALESMSQIRRKAFSPYKIKLVEELARLTLGPALYCRWQQLVRLDIMQSPFTKEELALVEKRTSPAALEAMLRNPSQPYGCTLLGAAIGNGFILFFQIGDGNILVSNTRGKIYHPIPPSTEPMCDFTYSLCMPDATRYFQIAVLPIRNGHRPDILLCTDGVSNSFSSLEDLDDLAKQLFQIVATERPTFFSRQVLQVLEECANNRSRDDATMVLAWHRPSNPTRKPGKEKRYEQKPNHR